MDGREQVPVDVEGRLNVLVAEVVLDRLGVRALELWVKFDQAPAEREYLYSGMDEGEGPYLYRAADGTIVFGSHTEAGSPQVSTYEAIEDDEWHQVVGTLEDEEIALYVDGFPHRMGYGQPVLPEGFGDEGAGEEHDGIVGASAGMSHFLDGTVDSVVVYDGAMDAGEVIEDLAVSKAEEPEIVLAPEPETEDADGDSVPDGMDNCPTASNDEQVDEDLDGFGDDCVSPDSDGDGIADSDDFCTEVYDPLQVDRDDDGVGVLCDEDEPTLSTGQASSVSATTANLNASIDAEGYETTYFFEYGTSTDYGASAPLPAELLAEPIERVDVSTQLTGLEPGTTYHYRVVASSSGGDPVAGEDMTFETKAEALDLPAKLAAMPLVEAFDGSPASLSRFQANWAALGWAAGSTPKGSVTTAGWRPVDAFISGANGAYHNQPLQDSGWGVGAAATMTANPEIAERYFSLWIDMPTPASTRAGYELRFTHVAANTYDVTLARWVAGARTELAAEDDYSFLNGNSFALLDLGASVAAWTNTGSGFAELLSASDSTFSGGRVGIEGAGNISRLSGFRGSDLAPTPRSGTEAATAVGGSQATLNGTVNPEGLPTSYRFEYGTTTSYGSSAPASPAPAGSGTSDVAVAEGLTGLEPGTTYHYRLVATNAEGTGYGEDRTFTTNAGRVFGSSFGTPGTGNGQLAHPAGIAVGESGEIWVVDQDNDRVQKFTQAGEFLMAFGSSGTGNGQFGRPTDIAIDAQGNLWVTDAGNSRVEKFSASGTYLSQFGSYGTGNGQFRNAESIAIGPTGTIWVGDTYNGRLQKFNGSGGFVAVVGSYGSGQGQLIEPTGIDTGPGGQVWVADWGNQRVSVFSESGQFVRQFGSPGSGNGQFARPDVIEVDASGHVWVGDQNNSRIQRFNQNGEYKAKFGTAGSGPGQFSFGWPMGIASDEDGNLWIADTWNNRVQRWR